MLQTSPPRSSAPVGTPVVQMAGVTKRYRGGGGVHNLTLRIEPGEIFGFLGPNGAGKTTTIRLLLDLIRPSEGTIELFGLDSRRDSVAIRRRVGYLPGDLALYERLTARDVLTHLAHLHGDVRWREVTDLADDLDLDLGRPIRTLSRGNRQKVGIVAALMGQPDLLVLDEPTAGLDPLVQRQVHEKLREAARAGRSVFLSSHILSEVSEIADRVGLIRGGELAEIERVAEVRQRAAHLIDVRYDHPPDAAVLARLPGVLHCTVEGHEAHLEVAGDLRGAVAAIAASDMTDLSVREPTLEELFLAFYDDDHAH